MTSPPTLLAALAAGLLFLAAPPAGAGDPGKAKLAWALPWDADWVTAVSFVGPDRLAAGNNLGDILVWDLPAAPPGGAAPPPARRLVGHTNAVTRLLATPDGRRLLSASNDHSVRVWDLQAPAGDAETVTLNARAVQEAAEKKRKAPAPLLAKVARQSTERVLAGHRDWVLGLALDRAGKTLVTGDDKGEVIVWDLPAGTAVRRWSVKGWVAALALAPDASTALVAERVPLVFDSGRHAGLKLWDVPTGASKLDLGKAMDREQRVAAAAFSPDGTLLAVARGGEVDGPKGTMLLLDPGSGKKVRELTPGHLNGATDVAFAPDGKHLFSAGRDTVVRAWRVADGALVKELGQPRGGQFKDWICAVAVSPDGRRLAAADMAGQVHVWDLDGR